jgi:hypothetical protein
MYDEDNMPSIIIKAVALQDCLAASTFDSWLRKQGYKDDDVAKAFDIMGKYATSGNGVDIAKQIYELTCAKRPVTVIQALLL